MVFEIAELRVAPDRCGSFQDAAEKAFRLMAEADGCLGISLRHSVEHPGTYQLCVTWESVEHHVEGFARSERLAKVNALIGPFFVEEPTMQHFREVVSAGKGDVQ